MTAFLEEFGSDPSWTEEAGTYTHDAGNGELEQNTGSGNGRFYFRSPNAPGGMVQECQGTFLSFNTNEAGFFGPVAARGRSSATDHYELQVEPGSGTGGVVYLVHIDGSENGRTVATWSIDIDTSEFYTMRLAAEGGDGANVSCSFWIASHGGSKPSLQDWIGADGSPDETATDTNAARLDAAATDLYCGAGGNDQGYDFRLDYHRIRLVSDRGGVSTILPFRMHY